MSGQGAAGRLRTALVVEATKAAASRVLRATTVIAVVGVCAISSAMVAAVRSGRPDVTAKLGPVAAGGDWAALLGAAAQVTAAGVLLALGVGLAWIVGREFADGTVCGLFGLPVTRGDIAVAKIIVFLAWSVALAALLPLALLGSGVALGLGSPDTGVAGALAREAALVLMSGLLAVPVALAATLGRGLLPGIATAVGLIVVAQVGAVLGAGETVPLTAPALWSMDPSRVPTTGLATLPLVPLLFGGATVVAWRRLQLDR